VIELFLNGTSAQLHVGYTVPFTLDVVKKIYN